MASPQALGSGLSGYNPFLPSDTNAKLRQIQLQQQLGQELQQQGLTPIDTNNRQIGNIGYAISPTEGIAKLAQALVGGYEQNNANDKYADALKNMGGASGQSGAPSANMMAAIYPEEAAKAMLGDHRPGASYWTPSGIQQSPTDLQINTGTAPNSPPQPAQGDPGGGVPSPQMPVQGPLPAAPIPGVPSTAPDPLAQYRQQNGMATPPIDPQRQAMGLPTGSNIPMGNPQVNASQLNAPPVAPQPAPSVVPPPPTPQPPPMGQQPPQAAMAPPAALPTPMPGESPLHFQARLEVAKDVSAAQAKAPIAAAQAGATTAATDNASNAAEALSQYRASVSQLPNVLGRLNDLHQANTASSFNAFNTAEGGGPATFAHRVMGDPTSQANAKLMQLNEQGLISQVGPQLAATGSKGNKLLEGIITGADSLNLSDGKPAVATQIDGLGLNYVRNALGQYDKAVANGVPATPIPPILMKTPKGIGYIDPRHVEGAIKDGATFNVGNQAPTQ